ncbi:MAG: LXG domain-containing protein, partial [Defluviitaleaceae bacterium]|nr:LXG domain-containing protein [Defluviitaleaceae bacterium]
MSAVRINLSELRQFVSRVQSRSRTIRSEINRLRAAFQSVLDSEALQGAIKQAIDDNITQFHFPIINGLEELHHVLDDTVA